MKSISIDKIFTKRGIFHILIILSMLTIVIHLRSAEKLHLNSNTLATNTQLTGSSNMARNSSEKTHLSRRLSNWPENSITSRDFYPFSASKKLLGPAVLLYVKGGLGNQLFQYACHYAIARSNNWPLYIFWNHDERQKSQNRTWTTLGREFGLDLFNIPLGEWNLLDERWNVTDPQVLTDAMMLSGDYPRTNPIIKQGVDFCQSEVFFSFYKYEILDLFILLEPPPETWAQRIASAGEGSVAVHVRRGDYVKLNEVPLAYFRKSMQEIVSLLRGIKPTFFVFSDDIQYLKDNLLETDNSLQSLYSVHIVSNPGVTKSYEELHLISLCRHQIISFSSFSWWGAYLNRNTEKIVLAAHAPDSLFNLIYPNNEKQREFSMWEYRHIYYPVSWKARHSQFNTTSSSSSTITLSTSVD